MYSLHALLEDRVEPGLTDKEVCPLDYDNADEEPSVTSLLQSFASLECLQVNVKPCKQKLHNAKW